MNQLAGLALFGAFSVAIVPLAGRAPSATSAPSAVRVLTCQGEAVVRPARYALSCTDASASLEKIHWTSWTAASATATAVYVHNSCTPSCARGRVVRYLATLRFAAPKRTRDGLRFSVVQYAYRVAASSPLLQAPLQAPCAIAPMLAALQSDYGSKVRVVYNGHLVCAGNLAEISVMIERSDALAPGSTGPVGAPHGALMRYGHGTWHPVDFARPNPYCTADGRQTVAVPAALGQVCGIQ
ncbi:MAG: hypothetical protein M0004_01130 [Actinomycetota bacterium]|nr:hypothetical protein [Actinomycetota bacterium]